MKDQNVVSLTVIVLIGERKTCHAGHDAEHIVVGGIHLDLGSLIKCILKFERQLSVVNTGEIACSGRLVLFGAESEGIHIDGLGGHTGVMLVRLHEAEVSPGAFGHAVVAVEHDLCLIYRVGPNTQVRRCRVTAGIIWYIVVSNSVLPECGTCTGEHPHELLHGVVEIHAVFGVRRCNGFIASELELFDEHLVGNLGESAAFVSVKVHIVHIERAIKRWVRIGVCDCKCV